MFLLIEKSELAIGGWNMVPLVQNHKGEALYIQVKNRLFLRESKDFSNSDIQLQLVSYRGHRAPVTLIALNRC